MKRKNASVWIPVACLLLAAFAWWYAGVVKNERAAELKAFEKVQAEEAKVINARLKAERAKAAEAEQQTVETGVALP